LLGNDVANDILIKNIGTAIEKNYILRDKNISDEALVNTVVNKSCKQSNRRDSKLCSDKLKKSLTNIASRKLKKLKKNNPPRYTTKEATSKLKRQIEELNLSLKLFGKERYEADYKALLNSDLGFLLRFGDLADEFGGLQNLAGEEPPELHKFDFDEADTKSAMVDFRKNFSEKAKDTVKIKRDIANTNEKQKPENTIERREDNLKMMLKHDFGSFAKSLVKRPEQAGSVCNLIKELEADEEQRNKILNNTKDISTGAMIGGAICMVGGGLMMFFPPTTAFGVGALAVCGGGTVVAGAVGTSASAYELVSAKQDLDSAIASDLSKTGDENLIKEVATLRGEVSDLTHELASNAAMSIGAGAFMKGVGAAYKKFGKEALVNIKVALKNKKMQKEVAKTKEVLEKNFPGQSEAAIAQLMATSPQHAGKILKLIQKMDNDKDGIAELLKKAGPKCS